MFLPTAITVRIFVCCLATFACTTNSFAETAQGAISGKNPLLKTDLMFVGAHPDDETGAAATLARYALGANKVVACVYCTRGEGGGNMEGRQSGAALGILRETELRNSLNILGVRHLFFLDQLDWVYTESFAATLRKWNHEETLGRLVRYIRTLRPEVIITMNPAPSPGQHGHHQAAGVLATEAFAAAADSTRFPDQITHEFLEPWKVRKLYYGGSGTHTAKIATDIIVKDGKTAGQVAGEAAAQHRSQGFGNFSGGGRGSRPQSFVLARTRIPPQVDGSDLLEKPENFEPGVEIPLNSGAPKRPEVDLFFVPRPAITHYREWSKENGVEHIAGSFPADIPVIAGQWNPVAITIENRSTFELNQTLTLHPPKGWHAENFPKRVVMKPRSEVVLQFTVMPESSVREDVVMTAELGENPLNAIAARATLHPVPLMRARRVKRAKTTTFSDRLESVPSVAITTNLIVQGSVSSPEDSSGSFQAGYDSTFLYVAVDVRDDHVISNIEPDDIKGHWRSDSVEICIDAAPAAEDTLKSYKLGIFPFDSTGRVRGARDADARQGVIEETAPGTRLFSSRTAGGYKVMAGIPFSEIGVKPRVGLPLRFNVIIYDGDKIGALPGENINKSRLAWAPRPGVQGRPEDWGLLILE